VKKLSPKKLGFLQAAGLYLYCGLIGLFFWKAPSIFGKQDNFSIPIIMLSLLVMSALICALIALANPIMIFWDEKKTKKAIKVVVYTVAWLVLFVFLTLTTLFLTK